MKTTNKNNPLKKQTSPRRQIIVSFFFDEDPEQRPGLCWQRRRESQALNHL